MGEIADENISEEDFAIMLDDLGYEDATEYEHPNPDLGLLEKYDNWLGDNNKGYKEQKILFGIIHDFTDRRGLRQEWDQIDEEIQEEILQTWYGIICKNL